MKDFWSSEVPFERLGRNVEQALRLLDNWTLLMIFIFEHLVIEKQLSSIKIQLKETRGKVYLKLNGVQYKI